MNFGERLSALSARQRAVAGLAGLVLVAGGTVGGVMAASSSPKHEAAPSSTPTPTPTPTTPKPKPKPKPKAKPKPKPPVVNPLRGKGRVPTGAVVAVKIDDTESGRPQRGIDQADIVYVEQAEGGLTRLVGVFAKNKPIVEAVRSVRASDPELLAQYGPIAFVASGGGGDSLPTLDRSGLRAAINDRGGPGFGRDGSRPVPYNLTSNLSVVSAASHGASARPIGFTWAPKPAQTGKNDGRRIQAQVGGTPVTFQWSASLHKYVRTIGGIQQHASDGAPIATPNVIVQFCRVSVNPGDVDVAGNPSQYTHSVGKGTVVVFRNGRRIVGTWQRSAAGSGTKLVDRKGNRIPLEPGGAWVVLSTVGAPLSSS